jgi:phosphoglycolate phosphatase-like HAD superfamily hydrolase
VSAPTLVWLFDVDGTLLLTDGAGRKALVAALAECYGIDDDLEGIPLSGRTDTVIVADALARNGLAFEPGPPRERLWASVNAHLRRLMDPPRGGLLPGVDALTARVAREPQWASGLLTGNERGTARIKLEAFGIFDRFAFGAFGDEAHDRDALAVLAVARASERYGVPPGRCVVVGDTELDIACARAAGARAVAVATGGRSREELAAHAPDQLHLNLTDHQPFLAWAREQ